MSTHHAGGAGLGRQRAAHDRALADVQERARAGRQRRRIGRRVGHIAVRRHVAEVHLAQVQVGGEEPVGLDGQGVEPPHGVEPVGQQPGGLVDLGGPFAGRGLRDEVEAGQLIGRAHPRAPSISSFTRRLNSMAYSIGSSLVKTSRKPCTMRFWASFSVRPRLIR